MEPAAKRRPLAAAAACGPRPPGFCSALCRHSVGENSALCELRSGQAVCAAAAASLRDLRPTVVELARAPPPLRGGCVLRRPARRRRLVLARPGWRKRGDVQRREHFPRAAPRGRARLRRLPPEARLVDARDSGGCCLAAYACGVATAKAAVKARGSLGGGSWEEAPAEEVVGRALGQPDEASSLRWPRGGAASAAVSDPASLSCEKVPLALLHGGSGPGHRPLQYEREGVCPALGAANGRDRDPPLGPATPPFAAAEGSGRAGHCRRSAERACGGSAACWRCSGAARGRRRRGPAECLRRAGEGRHHGGRVAGRRSGFAWRRGGSGG